LLGLVFGQQQRRRATPPKLARGALSEGFGITEQMEFAFLLTTATLSPLCGRGSLTLKAEFKKMASALVLPKKPLSEPRRRP
jgi:hypothetical protein